jgi:hypothetical protein
MEYGIKRHGGGGNSEVKIPSKVQDGLCVLVIKYWQYATKKEEENYVFFDV